MQKILTPKKMVAALYAWGLSYERIGRETGVKGPTISRLASGVIKRPREATENAIRALYNKYIGE